MRKVFITILMGLLSSGAPARADADEPRRASAVMRGATNEEVGEASLRETPHGVLVHVRLTKGRPGKHALHIHGVGKCEAPSFESAGGHFNPGDKRHGYFVPKGFHPGDLPNIYVPENGELELEVLAPGVFLSGRQGALLDADGAAIVIHEEADDYQSDPAGHAGGRIACGELESGYTERDRP
jgi:superoxide dismutase, Cu-Zn family